MRPTGDRPVHPVSVLAALVELILLMVVYLAAMIAVQVLAGPLPVAAFGIFAALGAAALRLRARGESWADFGLRGFGRPAATLAQAAALSLLLIALFVILEPLLEVHLGPVDLSAFAIVRDNTAIYLVMLAVAWLPAAFGEEMLFRGYLLTRLMTAFGERGSGRVAAIAIQSAPFAAFHAYQGWVGVIEVYLFGLVTGAAFVLVRRNLWPLVVAHGAVDTLFLTDVYLGTGLFSRMAAG